MAGSSRPGVTYPRAMFLLQYLLGWRTSTSGTVLAMSTLCSCYWRTLYIRNVLQARGRACIWHLRCALAL